MAKNDARLSFSEDVHFSRKDLDVDEVSTERLFKRWRKKSREEKMGISALFPPQTRRGKKRGRNEPDEPLPPLPFVLHLLSPTRSGSLELEQELLLRFPTAVSERFLDPGEKNEALRGGFGSKEVMSEGSEV